MNTLQMIGAIGFVGSALCAVVCWCVAVVNMFRAVFLRKPGVSLRWNLLESPFNILLRPEQLNDRGLAARRWCGLGAAGFFLFCLLGALFFLLIGIAEPSSRL